LADIIRASQHWREARPPAKRDFRIGRFEVGHAVHNPAVRASLTVSASGMAQYTYDFAATDGA